MGTLFVDKLDPQSGTSLELGSNGDTVNIPSGVTLANAGSVTGLPASAISSGTIATARLGSGTASSSTFLRGDQTYAAAGGENTPAFNVFQSSTQAVAQATYTTLSLDGNTYNPDGKFASNKFTPAVSGLYYLEAKIRYDSTNNFSTMQVVIGKSGSTLVRGTNNNESYTTVSVSALVEANTTDYFEVQAYQNSTSGTINLINNAESTYFLGFKVIT